MLFRLTGEPVRLDPFRDWRTIASSLIPLRASRTVGRRDAVLELLGKERGLEALCRHAVSGLLHPEIFLLDPVLGAVTTMGGHASLFFPTDGVPILIGHGERAVSVWTDGRIEVSSHTDDFGRTVRFWKGTGLAVVTGEDVATVVGEIVCSDPDTVVVFDRRHAESVRRTVHGVAGRARFHTCHVARLEDERSPTIGSGQDGASRSFRKIGRWFAFVLDRDGTILRTGPWPEAALLAETAHRFAVHEDDRRVVHYLLFGPALRPVGDTTWYNPLADLPDDIRADVVRRAADAIENTVPTIRIVVCPGIDRWGDGRHDVTDETALSVTRVLRRFR